MKIFPCFLYLLSVIIISIYNKKLKQLEESEDKKYLEYSFKRNLNLKNNIEPLEFFTTYFYNQLYINMKVGSKKVEIPFYFYLQQYPFTLQSSNVDEKQVKGIYDELKSTTYEKLEESKYFEKGDLEEGILSKDNFYLNDNTQSFLKFYLSKKTYIDSLKINGGKIGFKLTPDYSESKESSFVHNLKENNIISNNILTFKYDSKIMDEDSGKLYIGTYPHFYNEFQYNKDDYISNYVRKGYEDFDWIYFFDEVKLGGEKFDLAKEAFFYSELGFIIGTNNFFDRLNKSSAWHEYLYINKKCFKQPFRIDDFEANDYNFRFLFEFTGYYCNKDVNVEKLDIGEISFINKNLEYSFNLTMKDLWIEKNGKKFFMIIQTLDIENNWYFGKPFFKKHQIVFDYDNKVIGIYKYINETAEERKGNNPRGKDRSVILYVSIIIILVLIIIGLAFLLIKCYYLLPRKNRANELTDDNYDYTDEGINN